MNPVDTKTDNNNTSSSMQGAVSPVSSPQKELPPLSSRVKEEVSKIIEESERHPVVSSQAKSVTQTQENQAIIRDNTGTSGVKVAPPIVADIPTNFPPREEVSRELKTVKKDAAKFGLLTIYEKVYKAFDFLKRKK